MDQFFVTLQEKQNSVVKETVILDEDITPDMTPVDISPLDTMAPTPESKPVSGARMAPLHLTPLDTMTESLNKPLSGATKLRKMIFETQELVVCPGVYDGLSARTALEVGFQALYMVSR
jgi:hypothetical protein